jgi:hypothetical protein
MGIHPQNIGKTMDHGFAGSYARQPDMIVGTRPAGGTEQLLFGVPLKYDGDGKVVLMGVDSAAADFVGVASREIKGSLNYLDQSMGSYAPGEAVSVFQRGCINVKCQNGTPKLGAPVYVRVATDPAIPTAEVGGFEAVEASTAAESVRLENCQWAGPADANGIAEIRIMTIQNA